MRLPMPYGNERPVLGRVGRMTPPTPDALQAAREWLIAHGVIFPMDSGSAKEQALATLLTSREAPLRAEIERLKTFTGLEEDACPLCTYDVASGVHEKACGFHETINRLYHQRNHYKQSVEAAEKQLAELKRGLVKINGKEVFELAFLDAYLDHFKTLTARCAELEERLRLAEDCLE